MLAAVILFAACRDYEADAFFDDGPVQVDLAFAFSSANADAQTRQADAVVQNDSHRGIVIRQIIPTIGGIPDGSEVSGLQDSVSKSAAKFYHYNRCNMSTGVDGCLVYGKAEEENAPRRYYYGSLTEHFPSELTSTSDIYFELDPIYESTEAPEDAMTLAGYLNEIAKISGWASSTDDNLKSLFQNFINHGYEIPGSAASVKQWIGALREAASQLGTSSTSDQKVILDIVEKADDTNITETYPRDLYLPDGAAALRWTGSESGFVPQMQTTTLDNINSVSRFVYPASLYYFVESGIKASNTANSFAEMMAKSSWDDVLTTYFGNAGNRVTSSTRTVALKDPVQYGVAQLQLSVKADASTLPDAEGSAVSIGSNFKLTGVIVCGQRRVGYDFTQQNNSDANVKFVYDSQVKKDGGDYKCLSTEVTDVTNTLLLQSYEGEDVTIILELEYKGDGNADKFKCIDGYVYPGTRFYLVGLIKASEYDYDQNNTSENTMCVFTKDYTTRVELKITSLAKAYNVLPNILTKNLEIGVETTPQWIAADPTMVEIN